MSLGGKIQSEDAIASAVNVIDRFESGRLQPILAG